MLNISFFIATFSSIVWVIYCFRFLSFAALSQTTGSDILYHNIFTLLFPIAVVWGIFALIKSYFAEKRNSYYFYHLLDQIKRNTETLSSVGQTLSSTEANIKNGFVLQQFDMLLSDINEILSDIIKRSNSVSSAQIEHLWERTAGGERWVMAKTFIEINNYQPYFSEHLQEKALKDTLLKGSILEFYSRYKTICHLLNSEESQKIFSNMVEYGALGKVFEILTPIAEILSQNKPIIHPQTRPEPVITRNQSADIEEPSEFPSFLSKDDNTPHFEQKEEPVLVKTAPEEIEAGLKAIREELYAPTETKEKGPLISNFTQTQLALRSIKSSKEEKPVKNEKKTPIISLDELEQEINSSPDNNYDEYAYPFGAWLNDKKNS